MTRQTTRVPLVIQIHTIRLCEPRGKTGQQVVRFDLAWGFLLPGADQEDCPIVTHPGCTAKYDRLGNVIWHFPRNFRGNRFYDTARCTRYFGKEVLKVIQGTPALMALLEQTKPGWTKVMTEVEVPGTYRDEPAAEPEPEGEPRTR